MITWVTVWVLTVTYAVSGMDASKAYTYQLQYASQSICENQRKNHIGSYKETRCNFQQIPVYKGDK